MKREQQVCSLELNIKLRDLGVKEANDWAWSRAGTDPIYPWHVVPSTPEQNAWCREDKLMRDVAVPAFSVAELGVMLPVVVKWVQRGGSLDGKIGQGALVIYKKLDLAESADDDCFEVGYIEGNHSWSQPDYHKQKFIKEKAKIEADARAKLLIYLLENELITVEEVNKRLEET